MKKKQLSEPFALQLGLIDQYKLDKKVLLRLLRNILLSRKVDDTEIFMKKQSQAFFQISGAGHEGILSAVGIILKPAYDYFVCYYRDRALCLALGVTPYEMLCQANGNMGDTSSYGRQMPGHFGNAKLNILSKSSCTGTQFLHAVGLAEAGRYLSHHKLSSPFSLHSDEIVFVSSGDGTTSQGEFWESLTTAVVNKLPILYLVEDNGFAISVPVTVQTPQGSISKALQNFPGLKIFVCDGRCPIQSYATIKEAESYLRSGKGPVLVHATVTRPYSHSLSDDHSFYRSKKELEEEAKNDVINSYPLFLRETGLVSESEQKELIESIQLELKDVHKKVMETLWPKKESVFDFLYSPTVDPSSHEFQTEPEFSGKNDVPMAQALNTVLREEVVRNPLMVVFGEDVADFTDESKYEDKTLKGKGGVFKVTSGVQKVGRKNQVFNSPLAEANIIGRAVGMAARGLKPVVEIQFFDYIWTAFMQLRNEVATMRYRSGGDFSCPMVVRVPIGGYLRGGAIYHSQSGESTFTHIPGWRVVYPSNALDAAGLLRTAIRCDDPVLFLEHKHLYYQGYNRTAYPGENFQIPFGQAKVVQQGRDVTVVCWGALVQKSLEAAKKIQHEGFSVEIIDLRTLAPLDFATIKKSLLKTHRLLIAHEEVRTSGFAGEITALVCEDKETFLSLDAPIMRVTSQDVHVAYCPDLEDVILPQTEDVFVALQKILNF